MALFRRNFDKPGPGVPKNEPRKKGFARVFEILGRDFAGLAQLNIIMFVVTLLPQVALFFAFLMYNINAGFWVLVFCVIGLITCIPLGPTITAVIYVISKMLRDDPGFVWHDFWDKFKENFRGACVPGIVYGGLVGAQMIALFFYLRMDGGGGIAMMAIYAFSVVLLAMAVPYYFLQVGYLEVNVRAKLRNSLLLAIANAPRSLAGALMGSGLIMIQVLMVVLAAMVPEMIIILAVSEFISLLVGYAFPIFFNLMWIWPFFNKTFKVERTIRLRNGEELPLDLREEEEAEERKANGIDDGEDWADAIGDYSDKDKD